MLYQHQSKLCLYGSLAPMQSELPVLCDSEAMPGQLVHSMSQLSEGREFDPRLYQA